MSEVSRFRSILADPPWNERGAGKCKRGADRHYPLLRTVGDIVTAMTDSGVWRLDSDAHLYLWATNNHLTQGLEVVEALGFRYVTNVVWVKQQDGKTQTGLGQYFRGAHELLLFAVRGRGFTVRTEARNLPSVIVAPRTVHSRKPDAAYELIEARSRGPRLEMFAREQREGWDAWGNEITRKEP